MDNSPEIESRISSTQDNTPSGNSPGASSSLRRNSTKVANDEVTPLLGNADSSRDDVNATVETEWEGFSDFAGMTWWQRPSLYWLLPAFLLFSLAFGGLLVPKLNLILSLVCREYLFDRAMSDPNFVFAPVVLESENPQCRIPEVQALVSKFTLYIMIIGGSISAIMAPKLGAMSDRFGRKRLLVITSFGMFLTEIITILAAKYPDTIQYKWLLAGAVFDGLCGSFTAGMALAHAYAADCTPPPKRAIAFGYFHACLFTGIAGGPLIAAFLIKVTGEILTIFYVGLAIHTFFMLFVLFVVPESLSKKRQILARERFATEGENLLWDGYTWVWALRSGNILAPLRILWPTGPGTSGHLRANLILLSSVDTITFGVAMGSMTVVVYYLGYQFGWSTSETSEFMSIVNTCRVTVLIVALPLLNYLVRTRRANRQRRESGFAIPERNSGSDILDLSIIRFAIGLEVLGYCGYAVVRSGPLFILSGIFAACGGVGSPTLQSALTKHVPHDRVGQLLGATGLLHALARIVAPTIFNLIYAGTVGTFPQAVFVVLTCCFGVAFMVSWFVRPNIYLEDANETTGNEPRSNALPDESNFVDEEIGGY